MVGQSIALLHRGWWHKGKNTEYCASPSSHKGLAGLHSTYRVSGPLYHHVYHAHCQKYIWHSFEKVCQAVLFTHILTVSLQTNENYMQIKCIQLHRWEKFETKPQKRFAWPAESNPSRQFVHPGTSTSPLLIQPFAKFKSKQGFSWD